MAMLKNREVILVKQEVTYNTDPVPTAVANACLVEEPNWANEGPRMNARPAVRASFGELQEIYGGSLRTVTFKVELKGSGVAGTAPEYAPLLRACGLGETIVPATSVTYAPASASIPSCTIYYYQDGILQKLTGCRGIVSFAFPAGGIPKMEFKMTGHFSLPTDVALVTPTLMTTKPYPFIGAGITIGGYSPCIESLSLEMGTQLAMEPCANATDGFGEVIITKRKVGGKINPEMVLVATKAWESLWSAGTTQAFTTGVIGAAGNRYQLAMPAMYERDIGPGDRNGIRTYEIGYGAAEVTGDDEFSLALT
jgi:hypothetical protein